MTEKFLQAMRAQPNKCPTRRSRVPGTEIC